MSFVEGALRGAMLLGIASLVGWISHNGEQHLRYTQWLYRRKEPATENNSFVYRKRRFDRAAFIKGEATYINSLKEDEQKSGYEKLKKNSKLKKKYPGYYAALTAAYKQVFNERESIESGFLSISEQLTYYRKIYDPIEPSRDDFIIRDQIFESCQDRVSVMSDSDYTQLYEATDGNFKMMALKIIDITCNGVKTTVLGNAICLEHRIWAAGVVQRIDKIKAFYGNLLIDMVMSYPQNSDEEDTTDQDSPDSFLDDFEEVDLSEEEKSVLPQKKEKNSWHTLLLILGVILLAVSALMLRVEYETGLKEGYSEGYAAGEHDGYSTGSDDGYKKGYSIGYDDGRAAVDLNVAYESGYEDGYSDAINGY